MVKGRHALRPARVRDWQVTNPEPIYARPRVASTLTVYIIMFKNSCDAIT